jgi:ClpP class serine protease
MAKKIEKFQKNNGLELYTFAEGRVLGGAYYLLSLGNHVYADDNSLVGNIRGSTRLHNASKFVALEKQQLTHEYCFLAKTSK